MPDKVIQVSTGTTYTSGIGSVLVWAAGIDWLAITGVVVAIGGFLVNWYYQHKRYLLDKQKIKK
jgi:hypothetical protein